MTNELMKDAVQQHRQRGLHRPDGNRSGPGQRKAQPTGCRPCGNFTASLTRTWRTRKRNGWAPPSLKVPDQVTDIICENCGRHMVIKVGRYGKFLACPGYPECKNTKKIVQRNAGASARCAAAKSHSQKVQKGQDLFSAASTIPQVRRL